MLGQLAFHLRLAFLSLRQDRGLSLAMFVCLAFGAGMWTTMAGHYLREYPFDRPLSPAIHQVEIRHPRALALGKALGVERRSWHARTRVTFPEYEALAGTGIPARQTGAFRSELLVASEGGAPGAGRAPPGLARLEDARFVSADFFPLFQVPIGRGRSFARDEESRGEAVVVLSRALDQRLHGPAGGVGRSVVVEGRRFRVVGVLAADQPQRPEWDIVWTGRDQDALYVPMSWARPLAAWPGGTVAQSPLAPPGRDVWQSDAVFMAFWMELPSADARAAYRRFLDERFARRGAPFQLRSLAEWRREFGPPTTDIIFFTILLAGALVGAAFTTARLLLAKGIARREEIGIHRALGATRGALFARQLIEAMLVALPAALAGLLLARLHHGIYNAVANENDIPIRLDAATVLVGTVPSFLVGMVAAVYPSWRMARTPPTVYMGRA